MEVTLCLVLSLKKSIEKEGKRHDKAIEDMQRPQIEWTKKRQERLKFKLH